MPVYEKVSRLLDENEEFIYGFFSPSIDFASFHLSGTADLLILDARIEIIDLKLDARIEVIDLKVELSFDMGIIIQVNFRFSNHFRVLVLIYNDTRHNKKICYN